MSKSVVSAIMGAFKTIFPEKSKEIDAISFNDVEEVEKSSSANVEKNYSKSTGNRDFDEILAENVKLKRELASRDVELEQLKVSVGNYEKDKTERETALQTQAEQKRKEEVEALLKKAIEEKKIPAKNEDLQGKYRDILMKDIDNGRAILDAIPAIQGDKTETKTTTGSNAPKQGGETLDLRARAVQSLLSTN